MKDSVIFYIHLSDESSFYLNPILSYFAGIKFIYTSGMLVALYILATRFLVGISPISPQMNIPGSSCQSKQLHFVLILSPVVGPSAH